MSKRLFSVSVEAEMSLCVMAESAEEAKKVAEKHISDEMDARSHDVFFVNGAIPVTGKSQVEHEWLDAIPYGGDGASTVGELLAKESP